MDVLERLASLGVREADLEERFIRAPGPGGQKVNKSSSAVHLIHKPSGTEIKVARERSQALNRLIARIELCNRLETALRESLAAHRQAVEKARRQARQKSRAQKKQMVEEKRRRSDVKAKRRRVTDFD